jgi:O-antigen/teichoic acid export membrane protein
MTVATDPELRQPSVSSLVGSELKRLARHSGHYISGLIGGLALGLVSFPIFTRAFSVSEYGLIDLAQKLVLLLTAFSKGGLQNAVIRFYDADRFASKPEAATTYYSSLVFGACLNSLAGALLFLALMYFGPQSFRTGRLASLVYAIVGLALLRSLAAILWAFLRVEERTVLFNGLWVASKTASIVAICVLLPWAGPKAGTYFAGVVATEAVLVVAIIAWLFRRRLLSLHGVDSTFCRTALAFGLPLVIYELAFTALGSADRFLVQRFVGPDALGIYSVAYGLSQHANELLLGPLTLALAPIYMKLWVARGGEKTAEFLTFALDMFLMAACAILAVTTVSAREIVLILASSKYSGAERLIPWLVAGLLIYATHVFIVAGLMIHKKTLQLSLIITTGVLFNVVMNCILLPWLGLLGAAVSSLLGYALCIAMLTRASRRYLALSVRMTSIVKYLAAGAGACAAGSLAGVEWPLASLAAKSVTTLLMYIVLLYALDRRVRQCAIVRWRFT